MSANDRVTNPDLLTSGPTKEMSATMDFDKSRKTEDKKVSVVDVIAQMKNCTQHYEAQLYTQLVREERVPDCEMRSIARAAPKGTGGKPARPYATPVASAAENTQIIWKLPGENEFRKNCANVCVRYLGGDL